jgi:hypothetical protein
MFAENVLVFIYEPLDLLFVRALEKKRDGTNPTIVKSLGREIGRLPPFAVRPMLEVLTHQKSVSARTILRSFWMQALFWVSALVGYHFLIAAIRPKTGVIDPTTFPLYAVVDPVLSAWVIAPLLMFTGWLMTSYWFWRRRAQSVPIIVAVAFVVALNVTTAMVRGGVPALSRPFTRIQA